MLIIHAHALTAPAVWCYAVQVLCSEQESDVDIRFSKRLAGKGS